MEIREKILKNLQTVLKELNIESENIEIERPQDSINGDYSTNIALKSAKSGKNPKQLADEIVKKLCENKDPDFHRIEVAGPGFINFYLSNQFLQQQVLKIIQEDQNYGSIDIGKGKNASVEFVSANPTGPLHVGNARGGPIGDVIANTLKKAGYKVTREYLHNNVGGQVEKLGQAIYYSLYPEGKTEELAYQGEYITELSQKVKDQLDARHESGLESLKKEDLITEAGEIGVEILFEEILADTERMGIKFNEVTAESDLRKKAPEVIADIKEIKEQDGALWFAPNDEFLKDRETVVRKSDGSYTYFASDIVYHKQKFQENDLVIDVLGANHSGHVPRLKAAVKSLGYDPNNLIIPMYQFVRIKRGDEVVKMSKRAGNFITAREVLDEVGKDAFRFFLLMHKPQSHMDFDLELAKKKASENPIFYVQYAHARICSIFAKIQEAGVRVQDAEVTLLREKEEIDLIRHLLKMSDIVEEVSKSFAINLFATYAIEIASLFHKLYEAHQVIGGEEELKLARLSLLKATQITLRNTLGILGVEAPVKM